MFVYVACMLKIPISLVYKGVSSEIRVCCAGFVYSKFGLTIWKVKTIGITGQNHKDKGRKLPFFHRLPIRKRLCAYTRFETHQKQHLRLILQSLRFIIVSNISIPSRRFSVFPFLFCIFRCGIIHIFVWFVETVFNSTAHFVCFVQKCAF